MSQPSQRLFLFPLFLLPAFVTSLLAGCGGGSSPATPSISPPPAAKTAVTVVASSTANDQVVQANLTLNSLTLTNAAGTVVTVLSSPQSVEFVHLNGTVESLVTIEVPQDLYTSASATLGDSVFNCIVDNPTTGGLSLGSYATVAATPTVTLPEPILVGGTPMALELNLIVAPSQAAAACEGLAANQSPSPTENITPAFNLTAYTLATQPTNSHNGKETNLIGVVTAIMTNGNGFSVASPQGSAWSVTTNGSTVFQGVTGFSELSVGMPVDFDAALQPDGSLAATRVEVTDTNTTQLTMMRGPSTYLSAAEPELGIFITGAEGTLFGGFQPEGNWFFGSGAGTVFQVSAPLSNLSGLPFSSTFNGSNLVAGQMIYVSTHATKFPDAPDLVTATTVTLMPQTINGTVTDVSSVGSFSTYAVALASYDIYVALAQQPGQTTLLTNPGSVVVYVDSNTQTLNTAPLAVRSRRKAYSLHC